MIITKVIARKVVIIALILSSIFSSLGADGVVSTLVSVSTEKSVSCDVFKSYAYSLVQIFSELK